MKSSRFHQIELVDNPLQLVGGGLYAREGLPVSVGAVRVRVLDQRTPVAIPDAISSSRVLIEATYLVLLVDLDRLLGLGGLAELEARPLHAQREERDARDVLVEAILIVSQIYAVRQNVGHRLRECCKQGRQDL